MKFQQYNPSPALAPYIAYYWTLENTDQGDFSGLFHLIPDAFIDWVFHLKEPWSIKYSAGSNDYTQSKCHFFCHSKRYIQVRLPNQEMSLFAIKFKPWSAALFWGEDMSEFTDTPVALSAIKNDFYSRIIDDIYNAKGIDAIITSVEQVFLKYLPVEKRSNLAGLMSKTFENPLHFGDPSLGISQRRLEQRFKKEIGISPKLFQRTVRINQAIWTMLQSDAVRLTSLAYELGYFDQAHFIRDFKKFTGLPPSRFLKSINPDGDIFNLRVE